MSDGRVRDGEWKQVHFASQRRALSNGRKKKLRVACQIPYVTDATLRFP